MPAEETQPALTPVSPEAAATAPAAPPGRRRPWRLVLGILAVLAILGLVVPRVLHALHTESTDDAYMKQLRDLCRAARERSSGPRPGR